MTYPDRRLEGPIEPPVTGTENTQDVVPPSERGQDPERSTHELVTEGSRPLTDEERKSADRDAPVGERVYAPASERVPKTVEGHRDVIEHPDNSTPERQAVGQTSTPEWSPQSSPVGNSSAWSESSTSAEPSFTRVARPTNGSPQGDDQTDWSSQANRWMSNASAGNALPFGIGWLSIAVCAGLGVWLWMRWQRERNKPINRIRRQARETASQAFATASHARARASEFYDEIPEEAVRPAVGLGTVVLSLAAVLWQQSQSRSRADEARSRARGASRRANKAGKRAAESLSDIDWQQRLMALRELWNPARLELEKVSLPKR